MKNLLDKNPHAKALQLHRAPSASSAGGSSGGSAAASGGGGGGKGLQRKRQPAKRKAAEAAAAAAELVADEQLPAREHPMPVRMCMHAGIYVCAASLCAFGG